MSLDQALTIILPVRGRVEYTRRWLRWAEASGLGCRVLVADGSTAADAQAVARAVAEGAARGLPWTHRAVDPTHPRAGILARLVDAAAQVDTPYAALAANDDFPLREGLAACIEALEKTPAASACGGPACAVGLPAEEPIWSARARARAPQPRRPIAATTSLGRVEELLDAYDPLWYDVQRAEVMRAAFGLVARAGLRDLNLSELMHSIGVAAAGQVLRPSSPHLARQEDAADSASTAIADRGDLLTEILAEGWGTQFDAFVAAAADAAGGAGERARVRAAYGRYARAALSRTPGFSGRPPLRRRVAAAVQSALGDRALGTLKRARALARRTPSAPAVRELAPVLAFLSRGASEAGR